MIVKILQYGTYSDFRKFPKIGSQSLPKGVEIEFPDAYAFDLIEQGLAAVVTEPTVNSELVELPFTDAPLIPEPAKPAEVIEEKPAVKRRKGGSL